jgi:type I restriction-modification system DNA methylase subunit
MELQERTPTPISAAAWEALSTIRDVGVPAQERATLLAGLLCAVHSRALDVAGLSTAGVRRAIVKALYELSPEVAGCIDDLLSRIRERETRALLRVIDLLRTVTPAAAPDLLSELLENDGPWGSECATPNALTRLMVRLLPIENGSSILDPACCSGGLLIAAMKAADGKMGMQTPALARGYEVVPNIAALARINLLMNGYSAEAIQQKSLLEIDRTYDIVVTNPPYGRTCSQDELWDLEQNGGFRFGPPLRQADFNNLQLAIGALKQGGSGGILVPMRVLFAGGQEGEIRQRMVESGCITHVITLPPRLLKCTSAPCALLLVRGFGSGDEPKVRFVAADAVATRATKGRRALTEDAVELVRNWVDAAGDIEGISVTRPISELGVNGFNLLPSLYVTAENGGVVLGKDVLWQRVELFADVLKGTSLSKCPAGDTPVIQGRDLSSPAIMREDLERKNRDGCSCLFTEVSDVLIQRIGADPSAYYVDEKLSGVAVADTVFVIRFRTVDSERAMFLVEFLNSKAGRRRLADRTGRMVIPTLSKSAIRKLAVPFPEPSTVRLTLELKEVEATLQEYIEKANALKARLFGVEDAEEFATAFQEVRLDCRLLRESLQNTEDLAYQIRNHYPFHLAFGLRALQAELNLSIRYKGMLRYAENILALLATAGLALVGVANVPAAEKSELRERMSLAWRGGISPGNWLDLWRRTCSSLRANAEYPYVANFAAAPVKGRGGRSSVLADRFEAFVSEINNEKHHRGPSNEHEIEEAAKRLEANLHDALRLLKFTVQAPIARIVDVDTDWETGLCAADALVYRGDHPTLPSEQFLSSERFVRDHLYIQVHENTYVPLYPLLSLHYTESSKRHEVYHIDKVGTGNGVLKSLETVHAISGPKAEQVIRDFETWKARFF